MRERYPGWVEEEPQWMFNNAGGAMGAMLVLHCSLSEYVIIFGTPIGTEGHTGRYPITDDYFTILHGEQWAYEAGGLEKEIYRPGDQHHLPRGVAKGYKMPDGGCWALEYARGNIPVMLPFGFADGLSSTLDLPTIAATVKASAVSMFRNTLKGKI
jgi:C-8 sterol isomerase